MTGTASRRDLLRTSLGMTAGVGALSVLIPPAARAKSDGAITVQQQQQLLALEQAHLTAEVVTRNLDAVMATVGPNPVWAFQPMGYIVTGRAAVRESYRRLIANFFPFILPGSNLGQWFAESAMVTEDELMLQLPGGNRIVSPVISVLVFDGRLLVSERVYLGHELAPYVIAAFGPGFLGFPGVTVSP